jgi:putative metallohydrolase (TIGR04338 family)
VTATRFPRDSQRSRVYRAETPMPSSPLPGLAACAAYADRVVGSLWWQIRFPDLGLGAVPRFRPGNGARQAFFREDEGGPTITLPRRYRTKGVVLHELAHWALHREVDLPHHGWTFTRVLVDATLEFLGPERAHDLEQAFRAQRVRVGSESRTDPGGRPRYGWDERLHLTRGRDVTVLRSVPGEPFPETVTGRFTGFGRGGRTLHLVTDTGEAVEVPTAPVFAVEPARSAVHA